MVMAHSSPRAAATQDEPLRALPSSAKVARERALIMDKGSAGPQARRRARAPDDAPLRLEEFLPYRLNVVASLASQALSRVYAERYGIGVPEWRVLVTLGQYGTMTGKAVGAHSHMHKTKVSRAVAHLGKRKLLARKPNREDMREAFLSLTPAGRAIYQDLVPVASAFARRLVEAIDPADRAAFDRALARLAERAEKLTTPNGA
jgi:DNA-binding MarR family transcriptional regulator